MKAIKESNNSVLQRAVPIFTGIKDVKQTNSEKYTVTDKKDPSYRDIQPSVNQRSGTEFTYSFWLFNDPTSPTSSDANILPDTGYVKAKEVVLFVKGSDKTFAYNNICGAEKLDYKIKCPLVKLENSLCNLTVEFNTLTDGIEYPEAIKQGARKQCAGTTDWANANAHKLTLGNMDNAQFKKKWVLVTIVIKDTVRSDSLPYRNKTHCAIYLNNFMEVDTYVDGSLYTGKKMDISTIKTNTGNLYVFPDKTSGSGGANSQPQKVMIANLTYYNYAVDQKTIEGIYTAGVPKHTAPSVAAGATYENALDISGMYNEPLTSRESLANRKLPSAS